jgi:two-component system, NarL family, nitrate/nitrite response regulator NarL
VSDIRVLIVDDDPQFRQLLRLVLRRADGIDIAAEAPDGRTGIERAEELDPDVVLLDLMMPGMSGFEALPLLKAATPRAAVVVLTALDEDEAEEGVVLGASAFVEKRYITDRLEGVIRSVGSRTA